MFAVFNSVIVTMICSSLELLVYKSFNNNTTRFNDYQPEIDDLHERLIDFCASFSDCWSYFREKSAFKISHENERAISYLEDNMKRTIMMVKDKSDAVSRLVRKLSEELQRVRSAVKDHWDPDVFVTGGKTVTVEARVLVEGISWCLVKWFPVNEQNSEYLTNESKRFWTTQDTFLKKLGIAEEDYKFPAFLGVEKIVPQKRKSACYTLLQKLIENHQMEN